jgi:hypothetical protein
VVPIPGYRNRTIRLDFPELSEDDDLVYVVMRNPRTVPTDQLNARDVQLDGQGVPVDPEDAKLAGREVLVGLIVDAHVYDASTQADDQPLLALPLSPEDIAKLPLEIQNRIITEINNARNPTQTPASSTS